MFIRTVRLVVWAVDADKEYTYVCMSYILYSLKIAGANIQLNNFSKKKEREKRERERDERCKRYMNRF